MDFSVREAKPSDAGCIAQIQVQSWQSTYKDIVTLDFLDNMSVVQATHRWDKIINAPTHTFVLEYHQKIIGYINGGPQRNTNYKAYLGEVYGLYLADKVHRHGGGKLLFETLKQALAEQGMHKMTVIVLSQNAQAIRFYEKMGGKRIGIEHIQILGQKLEELVYGYE